MPKMRYDANRQPDAAAWLELSDNERIELVIDYHRRARATLGGNAQLHAIAHAVVESQVLLGDETPVAATLERLMREGLDRHDAIHAIGGVFTAIVYDIGKGDIEGDPNPAYFKEVAELTAEKWLFGED